jgi:SAM-dependent methyltransferase
MRARPRRPRFKAMVSVAEQPPAPRGFDPWARVFALIYDPFLWRGERAGLGALREALLAGARGTTVELGSGTGLNLPHYPAGLDELILTEPETAMRRRLERRAERLGRETTVVEASAEALPMADASVDTVVSTLVLCTVARPEPALREIARVLRPGGRLLFLEHVRSDSPRLARWQDRLAGPWRRFAEGCHCNRPTVELIRSSELELRDLDESSWRRMPRIIRPLVTGTAVKP